MEYVAYFPRGGTNSINLNPGRYSVEWLRAETGGYFESPDVTAPGGSLDFFPPNNPDADWVLHLRRGTARAMKAPEDGGESQ